MNSLQAAVSVGMGFSSSKETPNCVVLPGATFAVDFTTGLTPLVTAGTGYVYNRGAAGGTITDFEGLVKDVDNDEAMVDGSRHVGNLFTNDTSALVTETVTVVSGNKYVCSFEGTGQIVFTNAHSATIVGATGQRKAETVFTTVSTSLVCTVTGVVTDATLEEVTGQTNQNPSEDVSVGVLTETNQVPATWAATDINDANTDAQWTLVSGVITYSGTQSAAKYIAFEQATLVNEHDQLYKLEVVINVTTLPAGFASVVLFNGWAGASGSNTIIATGTQTLTLIGYTNDGAQPASTDPDVWISAKSNTGGQLLEFTITSMEYGIIDHGTNVDGTQYHNDDNRNTVDSNVVTETNGKNIQPSRAKGLSVWEERTNYADTDDANTQTIDLSAAALTDYIVSCKGTASFTITAGTATATISDATVTEASPGKFDMTVAGTMVITLDSGTLDTSQAGDNIIQLEAGLFATPFIPSPTTSSVTRPDTLLTYDVANIPTDDIFTIVGEFNIPRDPNDGSTKVIFHINTDVGNTSALKLDLTSTGLLRLAGKNASGTNNIKVVTLAKSSGRHAFALGIHPTSGQRKIWVDGVDIGLDTDIDWTHAAFTYFDIGNSRSSGVLTTSANGYVKDIQIIPNLVSDALMLEYSS